MKVYQKIASLVQSRLNCIASGNKEWEDRHADTIKDIIDEYLPSGSGVDTGTKIDLEKSSGTQLVFYCGYHHMDEYGMYAGWTEHTIIVKPAFDGIDLTISGRDRNYIKDYLYELYEYALTRGLLVAV